MMRRLLMGMLAVFMLSLSTSLRLKAQENSIAEVQAISVENVGQLQELASFEADTEPLSIHDGLFSPNEDFLVVVKRFENSIQLWNLPELTQRVVIEYESEGVPFQTLLSPDGRFLAAQDSNQLWVWETDMGSEWFVVEEHIGGIAFAPAQNILAYTNTVDLFSPSDEDSALLWDVQEKTQIARLRHPSVGEVALTAEGNFITTVGFDGSIRLWDLTSKNNDELTYTTIREPDGNPITGSRFLTDNLLAFNVRDGPDDLLIVWNISQQEGYTTDESYSSGSILAGTVAVTLFPDRQERQLWDVVTDEHLAALDYASGILDISNDQTMVITGEMDGVHVRDLRTGHSLYQFSRSDAVIAKFSPNEHYVAAWGENDGIVHLWGVPAD